MTKQSWIKDLETPLLEKAKNEETVQANQLIRPKSWYCGKINPSEDCCLSHTVGLARHPDTMKELGMMPYQIQLQALVAKKRGIKLHVNKGRQMGFTETFLRIIQDQCFERYAGKKVILMAGTRFKTTKDIYRRFRELWQNIEYNIREETGDSMTLHNGCEIIALPAAPEAITGLTKIGAILLDESAKWNFQDDTVVMNAVMPIVRTNHSDCFMISTPKGPRGFFYHTEMDQNDFYKKKYDIWQAEGFLYTREEIETMIASSIEDPDQEYLNQYIAGRSAIFGPVTDDMREEYMEEEF